MLSETNYISTINSFSKKDWEPLLELIPEIENTTQFAEVLEGKYNEKGVLILPHYNNSGVVKRFCKIVYDLPIIIVFNSSSLTYGRKMLNDSNFDFDTIDIPEKCKLITAIIRSERFCDGALVTAFKEGIILRILKSIKKELG